MPYTDKQKAEAIAYLQSNKGNVKRTVEQLRKSEEFSTVTKPTLLRWRKQFEGIIGDTHKKEAIESELPEAKTKLSTAFHDLAQLSIEKAVGKIDEASYFELVKGAAVATDKKLLLNGEPTEINETRDSITDDEKAARIAAIFESVRGK